MTTDADGGRIGGADFIDAVYESAYLATARNVPAVIASPPGRRPSEQLMKMHRWFESLSRADRQALADVVRYTADSAIFAVLCILDNVSPVVDGYSQTLSLMAREGDDSDDLWPVATPPDELHDIFRSRVDEAGGAHRGDGS